MDIGNPIPKTLLSLSPDRSIYNLTSKEAVPVAGMEDFPSDKGSANEIKEYY